MRGALLESGPWGLLPSVRFMPRRSSNTDHVAYRKMQNVACDKLEVGWRERKYKGESWSREVGRLPLIVFEWQRGAGEGQIRDYLLSGFYADIAVFNNHLSSQLSCAIQRYCYISPRDCRDFLLKL